MTEALPVLGFPVKGSTWRKMITFFSCGNAMGFPGGLDSKQSTCNAGDPGSIPRSGRSPGEGDGYHSSFLAWRLPWTSSLVGYSPLVAKEDTTEQLTLRCSHFQEKMLSLNCGSPLGPSTALSSQAAGFPGQWDRANRTLSCPPGWQRPALTRLSAAAILPLLASGWDAL